MQKKIIIACGIGLLIGACVVSYFALYPRPLIHNGDFVTSQRGHLYVGDERYRFVGVNTYSLLSKGSDDEGFVCGDAWTDEQVDVLFQELFAMGVNALRVPIYQDFTASATDFTRVDQILYLGRKYGIRMIFYLEGHWGDCSTGYRLDATWYEKGFHHPYAHFPISYKEYVRKIVTRYKDEPAILMWQLMNEAEPTSGQDGMGTPRPHTLQVFAHEMSAIIHSIDTNHIVSLGTISDERTGLGYLDYRTVHSIPTIDIVEAHDYHEDAIPMPTVIQRCARTADELGKPFFIGEVGTSLKEHSPEEQAGLLYQKLLAAWEYDVDGVLIWSYNAGDGRGYDFRKGSMTSKMLTRFTMDNLQK